MLHRNGDVCGDVIAGTVSDMPRKFRSAAQYWLQLMSLINTRIDIGSTSTTALPITQKAPVCDWDVLA